MVNVFALFCIFAVLDNVIFLIVLISLNVLLMMKKKCRIYIHILLCLPYAWTCKANSAQYVIAVGCNK